MTTSLSDYSKHILREVDNIQGLPMIKLSLTHNEIKSELLLLSTQVVPRGCGHGVEEARTRGDRRHSGPGAQEAVQLLGISGGEGA